MKCSCLGQRDVHVYVNKTNKKEKKERKKVASVVVLSNNSCVILRQLYISRFMRAIALLNQESDSSQTNSIKIYRK